MKISGGPFGKTGQSPAAIAKLPEVAAKLKGRWCPDVFTIGDAVQACCPGQAVAVMEAIRARTYPLSVNAWEHMPQRTEDNVIDMLQAAPA
jgi:hypothetical protein